MGAPPPHHRRLRSFVRREGRLSQAQQDALCKSSNLTSAPSGQRLDWDALFGFVARRRVVELGFGDGASLLQMAEQAPDTQFIGFEVYRSGVGNLLNKLEHAGVHNLRVCMEDAQAVLEERMNDGSLDVIQIFFPDPWPKKRHHKRRLIQPAFVEILCRKLKTGGLLHVATDWAHYAEHVLDVLGQNPTLHNEAGQEKCVPRPMSRPLTKYEKRGLSLGHAIFDIQFSKLPP